MGEGRGGGRILKYVTLSEVEGCPHCNKARFLDKLEMTVWNGVLLPLAVPFRESTREAGERVSENPSVSLRSPAPLQGSQVF